MREDRAAAMTTPEMPREELLELASLDALGLLDEFDSAHFTRSFHAAPASVQDEIRRLQASIATDAALLSDPGFRQRAALALTEGITRYLRTP